MGISQFALAKLYLISFLLGVGLGAFYDFTISLCGCRREDAFRECLNRFASLRLPLLKPDEMKRKGKISAFLQSFLDVCFGLIGGIALIFLFYCQNQGKIRLMPFLLSALGFCLFRRTLGCMLLPAGAFLSFVFSTLFRYIRFFVTFPILFLLAWIGKIGAFVWKRTAHFFEKAERKRTLKIAQRNIPLLWKDLIH